MFHKATTIEEFLADLNDLNYTSIQPKKDKEKIKKDCFKKLKDIEKQYFRYENKNISNKKLQILSRNLPETLDLVFSSYSDDSMPYYLLNEYVKVSNFRVAYLEKINEKNRQYMEENFRNLEKRYEKKINDSMKEIDNKIANVNKQLDGMWGNVLAVILSLSIVAAMTEVIVKMDREWVFVFCLFIIWIGMTLLVFFSNLFENKGMGSTTSKVMYGIVILLTVISFVITVEYLPEKDSKTGEDKKVTNINDLPVISNNEH